MASPEEVAERLVSDWLEVALPTAKLLKYESRVYVYFALGPDVEKLVRRALRTVAGNEDRARVAALAYGVVSEWQTLADGEENALGDAHVLLQRFLERHRDPGAPCCDSPIDLAVAASLPVWLAEVWQKTWGAERAWALGASMLERAPVVLRANARKIDQAGLLATLRADGITCQPCKYSPWGVVVPDLRAQRSAGAWSLPGWAEALFEIQDEGSQIIVSRCCAEGKRVLDLCCGVGGKTWALAAVAASVDAWDIVESKRRQVVGGCAKRGCEEIVSVLESVPTRNDYDVVLVDAPCSTSGVLRRHPSQRWSLAPETLPTSVQCELLHFALSLLRPGGVLFYATCSLLQAENEEVAASLSVEDATPMPFEALPGVETGEEPSHMQYLFPNVHGTDGFFMARWRKPV